MWGVALVFIWSLNLYLAVLLVSRGFRMTAVPASIPKAPLHVFALLLLGMVLHLAVGALSVCCSGYASTPVAVYRPRALCYP